MDTIRLDPSYLKHLHSQDLRPRRTRVTWAAPKAAAPAPTRSAWRYGITGAVVALIAVALLRVAALRAEPVFAAAHHALAAPAVTLLEDPVCHRPVDPRTTPFFVRVGKTTVYFDSAACLSAFEKAPLRYARVRVRLSVVPTAARPPAIEYVPLAAPSAPVASAPSDDSAPVGEPEVAPAPAPEHIDTVPVPEDEPAPAPRHVKAPAPKHARVLREAGGSGSDAPSVEEAGPFERAPNAQVTAPLHYQ